MDTSQTAQLALDAASPERPVPLGRYDVVGRLGRGGMGTVYAARDRERGSMVAIKTLPSADAGAGLRLKREFRVVADLTHPNLAPVYELSQVDGLWFFAMAQIEGVSFTEWARGQLSAENTHWTFSRTLQTSRAALPSSGGLTTRQLEDGEPWLPPSQEPAVASPPDRPMGEIRQALSQLAQGAAALHAVGIFHGDLKPSNILVDDAGQVILVDFGLSGHRSGGRDNPGEVAGTPIYMPPEQLAGELEDGAAADWYALGVLMYRVFTGWFPFVTSSILDLHFKKQHHLPRPPAELVPEVPPDLSELCMDLLEPNPNARPPTARIMAVLGVEGAAPASLAGSARSERQPRVHFVGREEELTLLERAYGSSRSGHLVVAHCSGPSGMGKSSLLASFLAGVTLLDDALVLRGRCYERENVPFNAFDRIVDELARHLASVGPGTAEVLPTWTAELATVFPALTTVDEVQRRLEQAHLPADPRELRRRAWVAMAELLAAIRQDRMVVITIDDLQWADTDSAQLLMELIGRPQPPALLLVMSYRPEARDNASLERFFAMSHELGPAGRMVDVRLEALNPRDAETLARSALSRVGVEASTEQIAFVATEAGGVPIFIEELARFSAAHDLTQGVTLEQAIRGRIDGLPEAERALVSTVAVAAAPLPQSLVFEAAGLDAGGLQPLLALRSASLVSWFGAGADDPVATYHDRIRSSVVAAMDPEARAQIDLALGRALARRHADDSAGSWIFEAVRHFAAVPELLDDPRERLHVARLHREAAHRARSTAAFPLAFSLFELGVSFLPENAWKKHYGLALALHSGAAESGYLCGAWEPLQQHAASVKANARSPMDQVPARTVEIDAHIGRQEYAAAIEAAVEALALLGVELSADPTVEEVTAAVTDALEMLTEVGPDAFESLGDASDPRVLAAMRIQVRTSPIGYFHRPLLLPVIAGNLIQTSIDSGLSSATPFALALFGIVLNTQEMFPVAHTWGRLALRLLDRYPDESLEAASRHVLLNLVCCWMDPLHSILAPLREVFDIGCRTGDFEYASYAAHGYTHNALYAGRPLEPLLTEAQQLTEQMQDLGQVNALHVHMPFVQLLKALTGNLEEPWSLDDDTFDEARGLEASDTMGSRSGAFIHHYAMGVARYAFGRPFEALKHLREAKARLDASKSVWHIPMLHQYFALGACQCLGLDTFAEDREALRNDVQDSLAALERLAGHHAGNFAHRVALVQGALKLVDGETDAALALFEHARAQAAAGEWAPDVALADEHAAACHRDPEDRARALRRARTTYLRWGAHGKVAQLDTRLETLPSLVPDEP